MMNEPRHGHRMQGGLQFIYSPVDGSTTQSWVASLVHPHFTHTQSRAHTLSQAATKMPAGVSTTLSSTALHLFCMRKRQTVKRRDDTVGLETNVFFSMCVCTVVCERQRKYWKWVREGAGSGLIRPLLIAGGLSEILFLLLCLDFFQLGQ